MDWSWPRACALVALLVLGGCEEPIQHDYGGVCVTSELTESGQLLTIAADSLDCASDHRGASFSCSAEVADEPGGTVTIHTEFQDGDDPNSACFDSLKATCTIEVDGEPHRLVFAGAEADLEPGAIEPVCLPPGAWPPTGE